MIYQVKSHKQNLINLSKQTCSLIALLSKMRALFIVLKASQTSVSKLFAENGTNMPVNTFPVNKTTLLLSFLIITDSHIHVN